MTSTQHSIERLTQPPSDADSLSLAQLLVDAVDSGAAVSFLAPLSIDAAQQWWRKTFTTAHPKAIFMIARDATAKIIATVQLHPAWAPNQPFRAEIAKLLVHRSAQRAGLGRSLMQSIESAARSAGFTLLTLDAKQGAAAEHLYRSLNWIHAGTIPNFALDPDAKTPHAAVIYYKHLAPPRAR